VIRKTLAIVVSLLVGGSAASVAAQGSAAQAPEQTRTIPRRQAQPRSPLDQLRYQIGTMERVLENAVEHGAALWRDRLQAVVPSQTLLLDNARARGYRLEGYGVFFDVEVPSLSFETTLYSAFRTLDENGLGLQNALNQLKTHIQAAGDANLEQALKRVELQVSPAVPATTVAPASDARQAAGTGAVLPAAGSRDNVDPILNNPQEAYRQEVTQAVIDAMLDHGGALGISGDEWLTIGERRNEVRPRIGFDSDAQTVIIRLRATDLGAFRAGQLSREDALKRVEVRVF
jgi:hypothetical protein